MKLIASILLLLVTLASATNAPHKEDVHNASAPILVFEGFVFGFLGDSADPIENCTLASQNSTILFWHAMSTFQSANIFNLVIVYIRGINQLIDFI